MLPALQHENQKYMEDSHLKIPEAYCTYSGVNGFGDVSSGLIRLVTKRSIPFASLLHPFAYSIKIPTSMCLAVPKIQPCRSALNW
jgi:hypothetical protein